MVLVIKSLNFTKKFIRLSISFFVLFSVKESLIKLLPIESIRNPDLPDSYVAWDVTIASCNGGSLKITAKVKFFSCVNEAMRFYSNEIYSNEFKVAFSKSGIFKQTNLAANNANLPNEPVGNLFGADKANLFGC